MKSIRWLGHSAFELETPGGRIVLFDPWLTGNVLCPVEASEITAADVILVTHDHYDHYGDTVEISTRTGATVIAQSETADRLETELDLPRGNVIFDGVGMNIGGVALFDGISVTMTQAFHSSDSGSPTGYMVKLEDGTVVYHAGDTGIFEDMRLLGELYKIDLALLPIGGCFTMDAFQASKALALLQPKRAMPMHYKTFPVLAQSADEFAGLAKHHAPNVEVVILSPGEKYLL